jgi:hypothetical protein
MSEMHLSQSKIERILTNLQLNQTESSTIEGKETLNLKSDGDCAYFVRHAAALANTGQKCYLIVGVENKTWVTRGIAEDSPLRDADSTQQQMNQTLANRLDPPLSISYHTCAINNAVIGVVEVEGKNPPYIVSIEPHSYGGGKSKGKDSYIYRGVIYIRRGADSVAANRQSEVLEVVEEKRDIINILMSFTFIAALVGSGIGIGTSVMSFSDPYAPAILGGAWGLFVGWIFQKRAVEAIGRFATTSLFSRAVKIAVGPIWGASIGMLMSYMIVNGVLSGKVKVPDPITVGILAGPILAVLIVLQVIVLALTIHITLKVIKKMGEGRGRPT